MNRYERIIKDGDIYIYNEDYIRIQIVTLDRSRKGKEVCLIEIDDDGKPMIGLEEPYYRGIRDILDCFRKELKDEV